MNRLSVVNHDRDSAGLQYVYPVVSRRAGGVSIGINLNTNNACNWRCWYCQVPNLTRGTAPAVDLALLDHELRTFLHELLHGDFMQTRVPVEARRINDIALSGNGEPTSAAEFPEVIQLIAQIRRDFDLPNSIKTVLITNGSLLHRPAVQQGVRALAELQGEVWFKLDRASAAGMLQTNDTHSTVERVREHLITTMALCPTWLQTCWFALDGVAPSPLDEDDYLNFLQNLPREGHQLAGVLLYSLARPSLQSEAPRLCALPRPMLENFAARIEALGFSVKVAA